jgi:hypothetical protein
MNPPLPSLNEALMEIERLSSVLHANQAHPDYSYMVSSLMTPPSFQKIVFESGWEANPERAVGPRETAWRRKR